MLTPTDCFQKWGQPKDDAKWQSRLLILWVVPADIRQKCPALPAKIYTNKLMVAPMETGFRNLIAKGLHDELKTWNGSFNIRTQRGSDKQSLHSWAAAFDINKAENELGAKPRLSKEFAQCFIDAGFDWGGDWAMPRTDGMHFQLKQL